MSMFCVVQLKSAFFTIFFVYGSSSNCKVSCIPSFFSLFFFSFFSSSFFFFLGGGGGRGSYIVFCLVVFCFCFVVLFLLASFSATLTYATYSLHGSLAVTKEKRLFT